ncbi:Lambda-crystallin [Arthrobotrys entomopaga]|nr:Lambda-crystallin [Arthrobotrys entomopaga]
MGFLDLPENIRSAGVIGTGQMGVGIGLVFARIVSLPVVLVDISQPRLNEALTEIAKYLQKEVSRSKISQSDADAIQSRISTSTSISSISSADFIVEAVPENLDLKQGIFRQLKEISKPTAILATNTSSISISKIALMAGSAADRVIGVHFMNPVPIQKGVEIIPGALTSGATLATTHSLVKAMDKFPSQSTDTPGFIVNRLLIPYINEAIICLETEVGTKESIDSLMKNGTGVPMGPLALADFIGLDTCLAIMETLHYNMGGLKYTPSALLKRMVEDGLLGKKSGRGFYVYNEPTL